MFVHLCIMVVWYEVSSLRPSVPSLQGAESHLASRSVGLTCPCLPIRQTKEIVRRHVEGEGQRNEGTCRDVGGFPGFNAGNRVMGDPRFVL